MSCETRMSIIKSPFPDIGGVCFILLAFVAGFGNLISGIVFLQPSQRMRSNVIFTSLAVSDMLVGFVQIPLLAIQMLSSEYRRDCTVDYIRTYFTVLLYGSSLMTLGVVAFDRYILLTRFTKYKKVMSRRNTAALLVLTWAVPAIAPAFRLAGTFVYMAFAFFIFYSPFVVLTISYFFIAKAVRQKEDVLRRHKSTQLELDVDVPSRRQKNNSSSVESMAAQEDLENRKIIVDASSVVPSTNARGTFENRKTIASHLKLAKVVAILITCYFCCITPINLWILLNTVNTIYNGELIAPEPHQTLYMFSMIGASVNSCLNPFVYFVRNPKFRKEFSNLLRKIKVTTLANKVEPNLDAVPST